MDIVDLVGSPSPRKAAAPRAHRRGSRRKRPPEIEIIDLEGDGPAVATAHAVAREPAWGGEVPPIIDLEGDGPASAAPGTGSARRSGRKRARPRWPRGRDADDDDVVEILSPAAAAGRTRAGPALPPSPARRAARVRAVFPLVSRARARALLALARAYAADDDESVHAVMAALAEDPLGAAVTEATFAAAALGRGRAAAPPAAGAGPAGRRKAARLECQCCFGEHAFEDMVGCRGGHAFCRTCLRRHTEQRVFGAGNLGVRPTPRAAAAAPRALEIQCMAPDCAAGFAEAQLRRACPERVLQKYDELQFAAAVESAQIEGIAKCPKCAFIAIADTGLPPLLFHCPRCLFKSCRECGEEYHPALKCDEVESKDETSGRRTVEEAMTTALVRTCPRPLCRRKFLKQDGCNKMTCSCGGLVCYVCGEEIPKAVGYKHFCQTPHCLHASCNKCPLYADTGAADRARVRHAATTAARAVGRDVRVDVEALLKDPPG